MRHTLLLVGLLLSTLPAVAQSTERPAPTKERPIQLRLANGSVVSGEVSYFTRDGLMLEMTTAEGSQAVWYPDVEAVRRDKPTAKWRKRPDAWHFQQRYDPHWRDPYRWEFGFYGDYGFGVGRNALDRYEVGLNVRYGLSQYLFLGVGFGMNGMLDIQGLTSGTGAFDRKTNTTSCSVFANLRGYFRNRGIRPYADVRLGYTFPASEYTDNQSKHFSDKGMLMRFGVGAAYFGPNAIGYSLGVAYQSHAVKMTEADNQTSFRRLSESVALQFAVTFRF